MQTAGHEAIAYRAILVPLDGSERAEAALPHAAALARRFGARLLLFRAVETAIIPPPGAAAPAPGLPVSPPPMLDTVQLAVEARDVAKEYLEAAAGDLQSLGIPLGTRVGDGGDVTAQILKVAGDEAVDLIVMTTHGRTGLGRLVFGSVAESVLHAAAVPVLILRTPRSSLTIEMVTSS